MCRVFSGCASYPSTPFVLVPPRETGLGSKSDSTWSRSVLPAPPSINSFRPNDEIDLPRFGQSQELPLQPAAAPSRRLQTPSRCTAPDRPRPRLPKAPRWLASICDAPLRATGRISRAALLEAPALLPACCFRFTGHRSRSLAAAFAVVVASPIALAPEPWAVIERPRYAVPFFFDPHFDTEITCLPSCQNSADPAKYPPITYGEYAIWFATRNYEHQNHAATSEKVDT